MNRYLFKAKRRDDGQWMKGTVLFHDVDAATIFNQHPADGSLQGFEVDPSTICQCTGLKDNNGNLIWENDIVAYWDTYSTENGWAEADCIGKVVWDDETLSFQVTNRLSAESYEVLDECSVIGNIFDNPELSESEG